MAKKQPPIKAPQGLLVGWKQPSSQAKFGFTHNSDTPQQNEEPIVYNGDGHLLTIAPTGEGKGVGCVIPAILQHDGPLLVMDLKGENYAMTRRHRRSIGSRISCIDPFGITGNLPKCRTRQAKSEVMGFNPFDLLPYLSDDRDAACRILADMLVAKESHSSDPFWREAAVGIIAALIECYDSYDDSKRNLSAIINDLGVEVPYAERPGDYQKEDDFLSNLRADIDLLDDLEANGLSQQDVWPAFSNADVSPTLYRRADDAERLMKIAALTAIQTAHGDEDEEQQKQIVEEVVAEISGPEMRFLHFMDRLAKASDREEVDSRLAKKLWHLLTEADFITADTAPFGSFAHNEFNVKEMENYPLAMHRLALRPSMLARSAAAQPFASEKTWGSILCVVRAELSQFHGRSLARMLSGRKSIDLDALRRGDNLSVYIAFPPNRIKSHAVLFRVIVEGLLNIILSRPERPEKNTLFLMDEVAQLGHIDLLVTAKTLLRGYGVQVWSFWQDISQLKKNYPNEWQTILNNCRVVQIFGRGMGIMASDLAAALSINQNAIRQLKEGDLLAFINPHEMQTLRRPVCYSDESLKLLCDDSPFLTKPKAGQ